MDYWIKYGNKVVLRECPDCVADAAEFLEEQLQNSGS